MNVTIRILAASALAWPLLASAQAPTSAAPPDRPGSLQQPGQATDNGPSMQPGGPGNANATTTGKTKSRKMHRLHRPKSGKTSNKPGDDPTYPASPTSGSPK